MGDWGFEGPRFLLLVAVRATVLALAVVGATVGGVTATGVTVGVIGVSVAGAACASDFFELRRIALASSRS